MNCYVHTDRSPVGACTSCGRPICEECAIDVDSRLVCRECLSKGKAPVHAGQTALKSPKDRSIALILEILPGLFGILGIGWMYAGETSKGIVWLISVLVWDFGVLLIGSFSMGLGCFVTVPISLVLIAISASSLNNYTKQHTELFG